MFSAYNLRTTPNRNTRTTSVVITGAKGTRHSRFFFETSLLKSSKLRMVAQNATQNLAKISSKSTIVLSTMNIRRNFVRRKFWKKFDLWNCEGKRFPPCFFKILWVGFTNFETPCDVPYSLLACIFVIFSFFFYSERVRPRESQGLSNAALKNGLLK